MIGSSEPCMHVDLLSLVPTPGHRAVSCRFLFELAAALAFSISTSLSDRNSVRALRRACMCHCHSPRRCCLCSLGVLCYLLIKRWARWHRTSTPRLQRPRNRYYARVRHMGAGDDRSPNLAVIKSYSSELALRCNLTT